MFAVFVAIPVNVVPDGVCNLLGAWDEHGSLLELKLSSVPLMNSGEEIGRAHV